MQTHNLRSSLNRDSDGDASPPGEVWIDIEVGDDEGLRWLASDSGLDDEIVGRLLDPSPTTYWRRFGKGHHFHVRAVVPVTDASTITIADLGIWLEPGRIITVRQNVAALDGLAEACSRGAGPSTSWGLIALILSGALSRMEQVLHDLTATIDQLEEEILTGAGDLPIDRVGELQRQLVLARRFRMPLANMVSFFSSQPRSVIDGAIRDELEAIVNVVAQCQEQLSLLIDRVAALQGQIRDQLADSMNTATYRFTWVATVFLPLSFLTGLFGINVAGIPGDHNPLAFWLVCGGLCFIAAAWGIVVGRFTSPSRGRSGPR